jgi:hypothetical protein
VHTHVEVCIARRLHAKRTHIGGGRQPARYNKGSLELLDVSELGNKILWAHNPDKVKARLGELKPTMVYIKGTDLLPRWE